MGDFFNFLLLLWLLCGGFVVVLGYGKALAEARAGRLVVYRGWGDFVKSSAWLILIPIGLGFYFDHSAEQVWRIVGFVAICAGVYSAWLMVAGAFQSNKGAQAWLALLARVLASLLFVFVLGKVIERLENFKRGVFGSGAVATMRGVLIPFVVFSLVFKGLIRPMIGRNISTQETGKRRVRNHGLDLKGVIMKRAEVLSEFLQYLKDSVPKIGGTSAEEYYSLGLKYCKGSGVKRDKHLAFVCFEHAAKKGLLDAQYRVGMAYDSGDGVLADKYAAFKWYMKAAERGHAKAQMCIGYAYRNGEGCEEDVRKAFQWYLKAAEKGEPTAQNNLAMMYECGVGVEKDADKARYWYKKSIESGNATASGNLKDMEEKLAKEAKRKKGKDEDEESDLPIQVPVSTGAACDVDLKSLVGLDPVKEAVTELRNFIAYQIECGKRGLPMVQVSNHCVFTGNPGTGKTTVARIIAKIYHEMGVLKTAKVVEVDRSKVVGAYIGHTARQMSKVIDEAMDGVLFIDEAYSLAEGGEKDFGREAVEVLLKRMDDNRDRLVVIVAGYTDEMHKFIDMNPGLKSRFTHYIEFPDYSADELVRIFLSMCEKDKYICNDNVRTAVSKRMDVAIEKRDRTFGNARFVRNLYEDAQRRIASRLAGKLSALSDAELKTFAVSDVE